ncbi:MAG: hypothetical protein IK116_01700, partial [Firmicutes bacterium]|nr:hypothetical protein [Bacillota bacterium]
MKPNTVISKKLLPALLVILVMAAVLCATAFAGANDAQISVGTAEAEAGSTVTLPVNISQNPGFATAGLEFFYNEEVLTLTSVSASNGSDTAIINMTADLETKKATYFNDESNVTANGVLCYLTFAVNESAAAGTYPVSVGLIEGKASNFANYDLESVAVDFTPGSVTVPDDQGDETVLMVSTAEGLEAIAEAVNGGETYEGQTITLEADIDLQNEEWTPIGDASNAFEGTFDGQGHAITG